MIAARNVLIFFLAMIMGMGFTMLLAGCIEPDDTQKALIEMGSRRIGYHLALEDLNTAKEMKNVAIKVKAGEMNVVDFLDMMIDVDDPLLIPDIKSLLGLMGISGDLGDLTPEQLALMEPLLYGFIEGVTIAEIG